MGHQESMAVSVTLFYNNGDYNGIIVGLYRIIWDLRSIFYGCFGVVQHILFFYSYTTYILWLVHVLGVFCFWIYNT